MGIEKNMVINLIKEEESNALDRLIDGKVCVPEYKYHVQGCTCDKGGR